MATSGLRFRIRVASFDVTVFHRSIPFWSETRCRVPSEVRSLHAIRATERIYCRVLSILAHERGLLFSWESLSTADVRSGLSLRIVVREPLSHPFSSTLEENLTDAMLEALRCRSRLSWLLRTVVERYRSRRRAEICALYPFLVSGREVILSSAREYFESLHDSKHIPRLSSSCIEDHLICGSSVQIQTADPLSILYWLFYLHRYHRRFLRSGSVSLCIDKTKLPILYEEQLAVGALYQRYVQLLSIWKRSPSEFNPITFPHLQTMFLRS